MSSDVATFAKGTKLEFPVATVLTEVKGARNFSFDEGGAGEPDKIDCTSHSTAGMVKEKLDGLSEARSPSLSFDLLYDPEDTCHAAMQAAAKAGTEVSGLQYTIKGKTTNKVKTFDCRVSGFPIDSPHDNIHTVKVTLAIKEGTVADVA